MESANRLFEGEKEYYTKPSVLKAQWEDMVEKSKQKIASYQKEHDDKIQEWDDALNKELKDAEEVCKRECKEIDEKLDQEARALAKQDDDEYDAITRKYDEMRKQEREVHENNKQKLREQYFADLNKLDEKYMLKYNDASFVGDDIICQLECERMNAKQTYGEGMNGAEEAYYKALGLKTTDDVVFSDGDGHLFKRKGLDMLQEWEEIEGRKEQNRRAEAIAGGKSMQERFRAIIKNLGSAGRRMAEEGEVYLGQTAVENVMGSAKDGEFTPEDQRMAREMIAIMVGMDLLVKESLENRLEGNGPFAGILKQHGHRTFLKSIKNNAIFQEKTYDITPGELMDYMGKGGAQSISNEIRKDAKERQEARGREESSGNPVRIQSKAATVDTGSRNEKASRQERKK